MELLEDRRVLNSAPMIVDNLDPGFSRTGNWGLANNAGYANSIFISNSPFDGTDTAAWTFNVQPGTYRIASTWHGGNPGHGTSIPIQVFDGSVSVGSTTLNQQLSPNDFVDASNWWENLGIFTVSGNTLSVRMTEHSSGASIADAIRIERVEPVLTTAIIDNLNSGFSKSKPNKLNR